MTESGVPSEVATLKPDPTKSQHLYQSKSSNDIRSTRANSKDQVEYQPFNARFNVIESAGSKYSNESPLIENKAETNRRHTDDLGIIESICGMPIPKNNIVSHFNDSIEHLIANRIIYDDLKPSDQERLDPSKE